ncbi:MAG: transposase [Patescibacteria group bacterium]
MNFHRNSQKRIYDDEFTYSVVVATADRVPFFREEILCKLWTRELQICKNLKQFELYAFCLNYDHFHLLLNPREANLSEIMRSLKTNFSRNANRILGFSKMFEGISSEKARSRDLAFGVLEDFATIKILRKKFIEKYGKQSPFPKFKWQKSFHDHFTRDDRDFENQSNYVIFNYLKHSLPKDWKYTSLNFPSLLDMS